MKIAGTELKKPSNVVIPIIRGDQEIFFEAACVLDYTEMDAVLKMPEPKMRQLKGEAIAKPQLESPEFKAEVSKYSAQKLSWMTCKSLLATKGLEWETVDWSNPDTWSNFEGELTLLGFNEYQVNRLINGVMEANGLSQARVAEAKERFLAERREQVQE